MFSLKNFAELANRQPGLATYCSLFDQYRHAVARHPRLICGFGVALDLVQRLVAGGGRDHVGAASSFGQTTGSGLAQTMGACPLRQAGRNRPDLIRKVDAAGLGDDPAILEFLSRQGRLSAGFHNDPITRRSEPTMTTNRSAPSGQAVAAEPAPNWTSS